jgi:hypothetical protein
MKITHNGPQSIGQIVRHFTCGNLFLSPVEYQRESAWDFGQKQLLIDTIFRGMDIPKFYLWKIDAKTLRDGYPDGETKQRYAAILEQKRTENDDLDPYVFEVVDGQQRIRTILEYVGACQLTPEQYRGRWLAPFTSLPDTPLARGKSYAKLNPDQQIRFDQCSLSVMVIEDATIDQIRDMFLRLQNGTPLNAQQKRDAMGSHVGTQARLLSELAFFTQSVPFGNETGDHRRIASQMLLLEYKDKIAPCTSQRLDKFYAEKRTAPLDAAVVSRTKKIVQMMGNIFPTRNNHLNRSYVIGIFWVLSRVLKQYTIPDTDYPKIRENFERLNVARLEAAQGDYSSPGDDIFEELSLSMSHGTDGSEKMETRHDVLAQFLFEGVSLASRPELDPRRAFTYEEKLILFHRAQGKCQLAHAGRVCGRPIPFDEAAIDHIVPHSRGGRTELSNGRYAAQPCNIARGARDDFDPLTQCCLLRTQAPAGTAAT